MTDHGAPITAETADTRVANLCCGHAACQNEVERVVAERLRAVEREVKEGYVVLYDGARRCFPTLDEAQAEADKCQKEKEDHDHTGRWFAYSPLIKRYRHTWRTDTFETFPLDDAEVVTPPGSSSGGDQS